MEAEDNGPNRPNQVGKVSGVAVTRGEVILPWTRLWELGDEHV